MIKENQVAISGRVSGVWNNDTKAFEVKKGVSKNGVRWQIFEISVSKKEGEDWVNGKGIKVMLWGGSALDLDLEPKDKIGIVGRFVPDNYTNRDGVVIKGHSVVADVKDMFVPIRWDKEELSTSNPEDLEDLPF